MLSAGDWCEAGAVLLPALWKEKGGPGLWGHAEVPEVNFSLSAVCCGKDPMGHKYSF